MKEQLEFFRQKFALIASSPHLGLVLRSIYKLVQVHYFWIGQRWMRDQCFFNLAQWKAASKLDFSARGRYPSIDNCRGGFFELSESS